MHQPILAPMSLPDGNEHKNEKSSIESENNTMVTSAGILERLFGLGRWKTTVVRKELKQLGNTGATNGKDGVKTGRNEVQNQEAGNCSVEEISKSSAIANGTNRTKEQGANRVTRIDTPRDTTTEEYVSQILDIHARLSAFESLKPAAELNALFGELVGLAIKPLPAALTHQIITDPQITSILHSLRTLCATSECELESHWASLITSSSSPSPSFNPSSETTSQTTYNTLQQFPYFQNYIDLARMEIHALQGVLNSQNSSTHNKLEKVAFIGSGPLPLTSLCLLWQENPVKSVLNIDSNPHAIVQSTLLCQHLSNSHDMNHNYAKGMEFACESATDLTRDLRAFDVVFLAALVGGTQEEKEGVLRSVVGRMRKGGLVVVRSSHGLRGLLYPEFEFTGEGVQEVVRVEVEVRPWGEVVNSVVVGRVV